MGSRSIHEPEYRDDAAAIGELLRARRRSLGLTQVDVAELAGTTQPTVSQIERGRSGSFAKVAEVAATLGLALTVAQMDPVGASRRSSTDG